MARLPVDPPVRVTPHGAFGFERKTKADGACGRLNRYPCVHLGVDLAAAKGTAVYAPEACKVVLASYDDVTPPMRGYGPGALLLLGKSGMMHVLGHLDPEWWRALRPTIPDSVFDGILGRPRMPTEDREYAEGEQVGVIAKDHVHWEVKAKGKRYDPIAWAQGRLLVEAKPASRSGLLLLLLLAALAGRRKRR